MIKKLKMEQRDEPKVTPAVTFGWFEWGYKIVNREKALKVADRIAEYALYGLIFFIPISVAGIEVFAGIAFIAFIVKKVICPDFTFIKDNRYFYFFLLLFIFFLSLSLVNSGEYFSQSLYHLLARWIGYIFIVPVAADTFSSPGRIKKALFFIILSTSLAALSGLSQRFLGFEFFRVREMIRVRGETLAVRAAFNHYNLFASYLIIFIPVALILNFLKVKKKFYKIAIFFWAPLLILALMFTFSRGGWLGFLAGMLLLFCFLRKAKVAFSVIILFILILLFTPALRNRAAFTFRDGGDAGRFSIWQAGFEMAKENPFLGKGVGGFYKHFPQYVEKIELEDSSSHFHAHNIYLQIWGEAGLFSLLSFLVFLALFFYQLKKTIAKHRFQSTGLFLIGIFCGVFSYLIHGFFDLALFANKANAPFWLMLGFAQALMINQKIFLVKKSKV